MAIFSAYPDADELDGTELLLVGQGLATRKVTASALALGLGAFALRRDTFDNRGLPEDHPGDKFFATDDPVVDTGTLYLSDGVQWIQIGTTKSELARAELQAAGPNTSGTTALAIAGLAITFTLATERAVRVSCEAPMQNTSASAIVLQLCDGSTSSPAVQAQARLGASAVDAATSLRMRCERRYDLDAGSYTFRAWQQAPTAGVVKCAATANDPAVLAADLL